jgi:CBS domain-containing protein
MERVAREVPIRVLVHFLRTTLPFKVLEPSVLDELSKRCVIEYYPKGTLILEQNITEVKHLCLIQKGAAKVYWTNSDTSEALKEVCGEGAEFGSLCMVRGQRADVTVEAIEDTFCFLLNKDVFLELVQSDSRFAQFYLQTFPEDFVSRVYSELRSDRLRLREQGDLRLFNNTVESMLKNRPVTVSLDETVRDAGARMADRGIGSLLVNDSEGRILGIVTDQDLRTKVVAQGMDYTTPVTKIMTSPVYTIEAKELCFEALLEFVKLQVDHLVVVHQDQIMGVVTARDIMVHQGTWPIHLFREIPAQRKIQGLCDLSLRVPLALRTLIEEGARGESVTRVSTLVNDSILTRLLDLLQEEIGLPPVPYCWMTLGSEGRKEQALITYQNHAIVYVEPTDSYQRQAAEVYLELLAYRASRHLEACGYPKSGTDAMASNPRWRKPYRTWQQYFDDWISTPDPNETSSATEFFDFRPSFGKAALARALRQSLIGKVSRQHIFLAHLAADCLMNPPPISFFRESVIDQDGQARPYLDLKTRCLDPFSNFGRLMAFRYGIEETNTLSRFELLSRQGRISMELFADVREAYEFLIQLNLVHQLRLLEAGLAPDSYLDSAELSELERKTIKEIFSVIRRLLFHIKQEFPLLV